MLMSVGTILLSFLLTTVIGGLLTWVFQTRSWEHKWKLESAERKQEEAFTAFEEISSLLDERLYSLFQLVIWTEQTDSVRFYHALKDYRMTLKNWNNNISRSLAKLHFYYSKELRSEFDDVIGKKFVELGELVEASVRYRHKIYLDKDTPVALELGIIRKDIQQLRKRVETYNLKLLNSVQEVETRTFQNMKISYKIKSIKDSHFSENKKPENNDIDIDAMGL